MKIKAFFQKTMLLHTFKKEMNIIIMNLTLMEAN